ncbi:dual specificity protein phosphatase family protein [Fusobacterium sp. PH5-44]|uniref:dual specificity protein phosphatase family protein n=1 Tax=unclassified Fusobacterium TaxID=2648384 RepID=UPI003D25EBCA
MNLISNNKKIFILILSFILANFINHDILCAATEKNIRNKKWATKMNIEGLDNLHKVSDNLYRSAQPTATGMRNAEKLGIGTIISLRSKQKDTPLIKGTNLKLIHVSMRAWNAKLEDAIFLMRTLNPNNPIFEGKPVLVHCYHGADRTGWIIALYRITYENWNKKDAIEEMLKGGYGYHKSIWKDIVNFLEDINEEEFKELVLKK